MPALRAGETLAPPEGDFEARVLVEDWRVEYNTVQPHSAGLPHPGPVRPDLDHPPTCTLIPGQQPGAGEGEATQELIALQRESEGAIDLLISALVRFAT
jgi:hypothetical protein